MIQYIQKLLKKLKATEKGQGMVEYALIIAFVAAIAIFVLNNGLRDSISGAFDKAKENVNAAAEHSNDVNSGNTGGNTGGNTDGTP